MYFKEKNYEGAETYLKRSCVLWLEAKAPNKVTNKYEESDRLFAFDLLGSLYARRGDHDKALKIYTELLKLEPNPAIVKKVLKIKREEK